MLPDTATEREVLLHADRERQRIVDAMTERFSGYGTDPAALAASAAGAFEAYATDLLNALTNAIRGAWDAQTVAWMRSRYDECLGRLGTTLRDSLREAGPRHAVAQALQQKVLEAEPALGSMLDSRGAVGPV